MGRVIKKLEKIFACVFFAVFVFIIGVAPVHAASVTKVLSNASTSKTFYKDITGDGTADRITVNLSSKNYSLSTQFTVNGKSALTISDDIYYECVSVYYIQMSQSREFIQIIGGNENYNPVLNVIYKYNNETGKFIKVLGLSDDKHAYIGAREPVKVTSSSIQISCWYQFPETGTIGWKYTYQFKNGKFKIKNKTAVVTWSLSNNNKFTTAKSLKFYTTTSQKKVSFTAKKGQVVRLLKIKMVGNKLYMQFQLGKKKGWKRVGDRSNYNKWFKGIKYAQ